MSRTPAHASGRAGRRFGRDRSGRACPPIGPLACVVLRPYAAPTMPGLRARHLTGARSVTIPASAASRHARLQAPPRHRTGSRIRSATSCDSTVADTVTPAFPGGRASPVHASVTVNGTQGQARRGGLIFIWFNKRIENLKRSFRS